MATPVIETEGLTKRYGDIVAVDHVSTRVEAGGVIGLLGPNGAGKTTFMRILLGLVSASEGTHRVLGSDQPVEYLKRVGALIEGPAFVPALSARRNLLVLARTGGYDPLRIDDLLAQVGLAERAGDPVKTYSLGMKQRLGVATALLPDPELIILDEPTNGLDPQGIREVRRFLQHLGRTGPTVFLSSHNLAEVQRTADRVLVLQRGRLRFVGTTSEMPAPHANAFTVTAERPSDHPRIVAILAEKGIQAEAGPDGVRVHAPPKVAAPLNRAALRAGITFVQIVPDRPDLEASFFALTEAITE